MQFQIITIIMMYLLMSWTLGHVSSSEEVKKEPAAKKDYCQLETFHPHCPTTEVILMTSATYGRMRIGRCITAEEVAAQRSLAGGDDPRILGCSADVLQILDQMCSGKAECEVRFSDSAFENTKPCLPGLFMYLEASHECIKIVDEERSCMFAVSKNPIHIVQSQNICSKKSRPLLLEAPIGQKISISLFDFSMARTNSQNKHSCFSHGFIVDKMAKRNASICAQGAEREQEVYLSSGNVVYIYSSPSDQLELTSRETSFIIKAKAVGCSDVIPPEDAWRKRSEDKIQIGCYSSRQTWELSCKEGKWVGVLGNCSQDIPLHQSVTEVENVSAISREEQVLAIVAICGITLAICLAIACIGAVCLRRVYTKNKKKLEYRTLNCHAGYRARGQEVSSNATTNPDMNGFGMRQVVPLYSVYAGQSDFDEGDNPISANLANPSVRL